MFIYLFSLFVLIICWCSVICGFFCFSFPVSNEFKACWKASRCALLLKMMNCPGVRSLRESVTIIPAFLINSCLYFFTLFHSCPIPPRGCFSWFEQADGWLESEFCSQRHMNGDTNFIWCIKDAKFHYLMSKLTPIDAGLCLFFSSTGGSW